jgi:hypothetical protein
MNHIYNEPPCPSWPPTLRHKSSLKCCCLEDTNRRVWPGNRILRRRADGWRDRSQLLDHLLSSPERAELKPLGALQIAAGPVVSQFDCGKGGKMHPILTVAVFAIALGFLYGYAKNSSFMCEASMEGEYQEGRRITCNKIRAYSSGIGERLRSEGICP